MAGRTRIEAAYAERLEDGLLEADAAQAAAVEELAALERRLSRARPARKGLLGTSLGARPARGAEGLYLWGGVGRGKSMLMDMFHDAAPLPEDAKLRRHFHAFMRDVHARIKDWRALSKGKRRRSPLRGDDPDDPVVPAAKGIAERARLLCFDEFQVTQIADAMIMSRLFSALFEAGVTLVATSNRAPADLYRDGINRELFLPFIGTLGRRCRVHHLDAPRDFRLERLREARVWHAPLGEAAARAAEAAWEALTLGRTPRPLLVRSAGRATEVGRRAAGTGRADFSALCEAALGPADYLDLAANLHTLILEGIPELSPADRNSAIRFTNLIDALYEAKVKLVATAAAEPSALYPEGDGSFEFARTASRIEEMRSDEYLAAERQRPAMDDSPETRAPSPG